VTAQIIGAVLVTAAACAVAAFVALMRQAGRHSDDRAALLRGQLDAYRAGQASVPGQAADDGEALETWERDELGRIERFYADDADEPARRPGGTP
jgi:hypothetical protein